MDEQFIRDLIDDFRDEIAERKDLPANARYVTCALQPMTALLDHIKGIEDKLVSLQLELDAAKRERDTVAVVGGKALRELHQKALRGLHGRDCPKVAHVGDGYLHGAEYDGEYDVDGVMYCGRCHGWVGCDIQLSVVERHTPE